MFTAYNKVRMHDTDMAGILYFPRQFRFAHDALEDFMAQTGLTFEKLFHQEHFVFVIVHAEADYLSPLKVGDSLEIQVFVEKIGNSSFTIFYKIFKENKTLTGIVRTVHVTLDSKNRKKMPIPVSFKSFLEAHLIPAEG